MFSPEQSSKNHSRMLQVADGVLARAGSRTVASTVLATSLFLGLSLAAASAAHAQESTPPYELELEEVVVSAQRRAENLQLVPVAVTALDQSMLDARRVIGPEKLQYVAPSFIYSEFAPGQAMMAIRGISSNDDGPAMDSSVGVFVDDVYSGRQTSVNFEIFEVEQLEVLRGPQGTLFGRNTIGGAINIRSRQPNLEEAEGRVLLTYGSYDTVELGGYGSAPFSDRVAGNLAFKYRNSGGWQRNLINGDRGGEGEMATIRGHLLIEPNDGFNLTLTGHYLSDDLDAVGRMPYRNNAGNFVVEEFLALGGRWGDRALNVTPSHTERDIYGVSARANFELGSGTLTSITAYQKTDLNFVMDAIGVPSWPVGDIIDDQSDFTSQEFRFASNYDGPFNFVAGLFGYWESVSRHEIYDFFFGASRPATIADAETTSYALFGQGTYDISDRMTLTVGARWTRDEKDYRAAGIPGFIIIAEEFDVSTSESWNNFSPKVALSYRFTPEVFGYVSISEGYKSGGFGGSPGFAAEAVVPVEQEEAIAYEVGVRTDLLDKRLRLNATGFYTDYTDLQIVRFGPPLDGSSPFGVFTTINAESARIIGLELEATALITENLQINGNYTHTDAEYTDFIFPGPPPVDLSGRRMLRTPDNKLNIAAQYSMPAPGGMLLFDLSYSYLSDQDDELQPDPNAERLIIPSYSLVDAFVTYEHSASGLSVKLWGDNLTDEVYPKSLYNIGPAQIAAFGNPRTYGVTLEKRF